jgi:hypothetical protein
MTEFKEAVADLKWDKETAIKDFDDSIKEMITFSTKWMDKLDEKENRKLSDGVSDMAARAAADIPNNPVTGTLKVNKTERKEEAEKLLSSTTSKLEDQDAKEFGELFGKLIDSYGEVYKLCKGIK